MIYKPETTAEKIAFIFIVCFIAVMAVLIIAAAFHLIEPGYGR